MATTAPLPDLPLPDGIRSRYVDNGNGLEMHVLVAGDDREDRPAVLLLHGFPELAYSWRRVMPALAEAGFYVIAPTSAATDAPVTGRPISITTIATDWPDSGC